MFVYFFTFFIGKALCSWEGINGLALSVFQNPARDDKRFLERPRSQSGIVKAL